MEQYLGQIVMFGGNFAPRNWAFCDGQILPINSNQALFSILGTTYGGDGRTTFALPDLRGRVPIHAGQGPGLRNRDLGAKGGSEQTIMTLNEMPNHNHLMTVDGNATVKVHNDGGNNDTPSGHNFANSEEDDFTTENDDVMMQGANVDLSGVSVTTSNTGSSTPINNMAPFLAMNYIIAIQGVFPSRN